MSSIYHKHENQPSIYKNILNFKKRFGSYGPSAIIDKKTGFWHHFCIIRGKKGSEKFGQQGPFFTHIWNYPQNACNPSFMVWHYTFFENKTKNTNSNIFFVIEKKSIKNSQAEIKIPIIQICWHYCCAYSSHISERLDEFWWSLWPKTSKTPLFLYPPQRS